MFKKAGTEKFFLSETGDVKWLTKILNVPIMISENVIFS